MEPDDRGSEFAEDVRKSINIHERRRDKGDKKDQLCDLRGLAEVIGSYHCTFQS